MARIPVVQYQSPVGSANTTGTVVQMRGPAQPREQFPSRALNRTQSAVRQATRQATSSDDADCTVIRGVSFVGGAAQTLSHGLTDSKGQPRAWTSYRIENMRGNYSGFFAAPNGLPQDAHTIVLFAQFNVTADVRVW